MKNQKISLFSINSNTKIKNRVAYDHKQPDFSENSGISYLFLNKTKLYPKLKEGPTNPKYPPLEFGTYP